MSMIPKAIYRLNTIPIKIPMPFFTQLEQIFQKFIWKHRRPRIATVILRKKNQVGRIILLNIKLHYKAIVITTVWYWHKNRNIVPWNRVEIPEMKPQFYSLLIFDRESKHI